MRRTLADTVGRRYEDYFRDRTPVPFEIVVGNGATHRFGVTETVPPRFSLVVRDGVGHRALRSLDQLQVAMAYLGGHLDVEGDLAAALTMRRFFSDVHPVAFLGRWLPAVVHGRYGHDQRSISRHYDEESDFFLTFLDTRHRCYTQGVFARDDEALEDAVTRKLDLALDAIGVGPGDRVLEVGGGWGAFAEHAARRGVVVTTVTLAAESERFLTDLFAREKLPVTVVRDHILRYRAAEPFDAIVNMGVTEHLPDYRATLQAYARLLRPGGRIYLDALAMRRKQHLSTFFKQHIYPGNSAPLVLHSYLRHVARSPFELLSVDDDRHNYFLTCRAWAQRLDARREDIIARWGEPLYRRFRIFLWGSAAGFDTGLVQAYRWVLRRGPVRPTGTVAAGPR
ncbi:class I SAM-dependent methyltransferase [Micromonospora costi]|uniref:Class I SAM-dependent methyltransferase n=1 Tax=Micromonospora costi TaxID=1530042 RepID=A0A3B0A0H3_9ACTN|nr:class I SAM-dependent methyltransferase [Micromonospora costi]RKN53066.1 class I SAM-dependent methyltransferase [Micromonospora costi]